MIEPISVGGLLGLLGSVASAVLAYFKQRQDHKYSQERLELERSISLDSHAMRMDEIREEAERSQAELRIEAERAVTQAEHQSLEASYQQLAPYAGDDKLLRWAEFARRLTRPLITLLPLVLTGVVYALGAADIRVTISQAVVVMAATAVSWWFADRQVAKMVATRMFGQ